MFIIFIGNLQILMLAPVVHALIYIVGLYIYNTETTQTLVYQEDPLDRAIVCQRSDGDQFSFQNLLYLPLVVSQNYYTRQY